MARFVTYCFLTISHFGPVLALDERFATSLGLKMKNILTTVAIALGIIVLSGPAFAGAFIRVPEPMSMSLLAGGVLAIAAVKRLRRK